MYFRRKTKTCPFCSSKIKRVAGEFKCENCGAVIKPAVFETKTLNINFFNSRR